MWSGKSLILILIGLARIWFDKTAHVTGREILWCHLNRSIVCRESGHVVLIDRRDVTIIPYHMTIFYQDKYAHQSRLWVIFVLVKTWSNISFLWLFTLIHIVHDIMLISYSFYRSISNPFNIVTSLDNRHKYCIHDVTLNRIKLSLKNIYVFIHVLRNNQR